MHLFALALVLPLLPVKGQDLRYRIICELKSALVVPIGRRCDGCEYRHVNYVDPEDTDLLSQTSSVQAKTITTVYITRNYEVARALKAHGIMYVGCFNKIVTPTRSNGLTQATTTEIVCSDPLEIQFRQACDNRNRPQAFAPVTLQCPPGHGCRSISYEYRISVETENGQPCPVLYNIIIEMKEQNFGGRKCKGCAFFFLFYLRPPFESSVTSRITNGRKLTLTLSSAMVTDLKVYGINYASVCVSKRFTTPDANGVTQARQDRLACQPHRDLTLREACANRNQPDAFQVVTLPCLAGERPDCTKASIKYRIHVETEYGEACPEIILSYNIIIEIKERNFGDRACDGCMFLYYFRPYESYIWNATAIGQKLTFKLNAAMVTSLKANGIDYEKVCLSKKFTTPDANGVTQAPQHELACQPQQRLTFREACANRNRPDDWKLVTLPCLAGESANCRKASTKYRIYVETEFGHACPASETP